MDKGFIVAVLLLLAGCSGMPAPRAVEYSSSVCHRGEVSYPCDRDPLRY